MGVGEDLVDLIRWQERAMLTGMSRLAATAFAPRGARRFGRRTGRVGRGWLGRVARMLGETRFEVGDALGELLVLLQQGVEHRAHGGRRGGPVFLGDFWYWRHIIVHSVYHTENAVGVKVGRRPERLRFDSRLV
jgi:hypothetical protein